MRENVFWGHINPEHKTFLSREEMIEHMTSIKINLDAIDVGIFFDYMDDQGHGKISYDDFDKVMHEGESRGLYWDKD